jgi:hypothetical protein
MPKNEAKGNIFGKTQRGTFKGTAGPGPGAYKVPVKVADVPAYALPNQKEEFKFV